MKKISKTWQFKAVIALIGFLLVLMIIAGVNGRLSTFPGQLVSALMQPFQRLGTAVSSKAGTFGDKYVFYETIQQENEALQQEVHDLRQQLVDYDRYKAENEQLKEFYDIQEKNPEWSMVSASVIGRDPLGTFYSFTIDRGQLDGIKIGDTVIASGGSLVGIVQEIGPNYAKITTVLDPALNAAAMISRTRDSGLAGGDVELAQEGYCSMVHLSRETTAIVGDIVITTGMGGVFPKDLRIGTIEDLRADNSGKSLYAVVLPEIDPASVRAVMVITEFS